METTEHYDFIIVGAGSAGCVLVDRLSASGRHRVLLIEAGGSDRHPWVRIPVGYGFTFQDARFNWKYHTAPDPGLGGRRGYWPRGRVLGGSSSINAMVYARGLPQDFDDWGAAAPGWSAQIAEQSYARIERQVEWVDGQRRVRGDGPLSISDVRGEIHPFNRHFFSAVESLGWPMIEDMNGAQNEGLGVFRLTTRDGWRCSSADAFLRPALKRPNLRLVKKALAERLLFDGGRANGVAYRLGERTVEVRAAREVILSAGAINSPQLLQLSGIGPADLLRRHGIALRADLPEVGGGLQDHLAINNYYETDRQTINQQLGPWHGRLRAALQYALTRRGPLSIGVNQIGGYFRSSPDRPMPDMQLYCCPASYTARTGSAAKLDKSPGFLLSVQPCRPSSRGRVDIASGDPREAPTIQPNSLSTEEDRADVLRGYGLIRQLLRTPALQAVTRAHRTPNILAMSDDELLEDFRQRCSTNFHPSCSCRMGRDAADSVLDSRLRVHGVAGLRVVDASAFPNVTSGNTNAPTMMLAQRSAELILEDHS